MHGRMQTDAQTDARTHTHIRTDKANAICPFNISKVGGITMKIYLATMISIAWSLNGTI